MLKFILFSFILIPSWVFALTHESEISSVTTGGNSNVETYLFKTLHQVQQETLTYRISGHYTYGEAAKEVSARDWDINLKFDQMMTRKVAYYIGEMVEGYRFQDIKARYNSDIGLKYYFIKKDNRNFFTEGGFRYTVEDRYGPSQTQFENKGRLYQEYNDKPSKYFSYRLWLEYIPNFTTKGDYLIIHEASITSILSSIFSLKVAFRGSYDNRPATVGNKNYDYSYTTSLVARF